MYNVVFPCGWDKSFLLKWNLYFWSGTMSHRRKLGGCRLHSQTIRYFVIVFWTNLNCCSRICGLENTCHILPTTFISMKKKKRKRRTEEFLKNSFIYCKIINLNSFFLSQISVSPDSRNTSWVSFDGRNRQELFHGDR